MEKLMFPDPELVRRRVSADILSNSSGRIDKTLSSRTVSIFMLRFVVLGWMATTPWPALTGALITVLSTVMLTFFSVLVTAA